MKPRLARTLAVLALLAMVAFSPTQGQGRTGANRTAADIASRATVRPSLSGTRVAAAKSAGRAVTPLLRRMLPGTPGPEWLGVRVHALPASHLPVVGSTASAAKSTPATVPSTATTISPAPSTPVTDATSTNTADWNCIAAHESGGSYTIGGAEPYGGKYQFSLETWRALGFPGVPNTSPPWMQDQAALKLWAWDLKYTGNPWSAWQTAPACHLW